MKISALFIAGLFAMTSCIAQNKLSTATSSNSIIKEYNGNIGIGTSVPDELLTVKGKIHTQEVLVDLNGAVAPDYVFETYYNGSSTLNPAYQLLKLEQVSAYIKKHHHLPDVASAATLAEKGLELKKMNLLLLQKIEELTIYTIEQQSQIDELKAAVSKLTKE